MNPIVINQHILKNTPVPVMPAGLNRLLKVFEDDTITHSKLAEIISDYPSIAARLIFLANSAWAAPRIPVENVVTACGRLGLSMVRSVSISLCIVSSFDAINRCPGFDWEYFWCSSLLTAEGAVQLALHLNNVNSLNSATLHTAGLLHNLGLLWLADNWPKEISQALEWAAADKDKAVSTQEALRSMTGIDYCEAGGILGRSWNLPGVLVSAMEQHKRGVYPQSEYPSTIIVGYAAEMVSALQSGREKPPPLPTLEDAPFDPGRLEETYRKLQGQLIKIRELARTLFSVH
ncbi:MAG: HDOD domain-containing protein [Gammaproteobacteria bacterium]